MDPERSFVEGSIHYILHALSRDELHFLLSQDGEWQKFVADADLSRNESEAIREGLSKEKMLTATEAQEIHQQEQEHRERFLKLFPQVKEDIEKHIEQLQALAEKADHVHKDCTVANIVADSMGLLSGILTFAGIGLAPFTGGISLALSATGMGLGALSVTTTVTSSIVEHTNMSSIEAEAKHLESAGINPVELAQEVLSDSSHRIASEKNSFNAFKRIARHVRALKLARASPELAARITAQSNSLVQKVFGGTPKVIKGVGLFRMAMTGLSIIVDIYNLVENSSDLQAGAKTKTAEELRQHATMLQELLEELNQVYANLQ